MEKSINMGIGHYFRAKKVGRPKKLLKETNFFFYLIANIFFLRCLKSFEKETDPDLYISAIKTKELICLQPAKNEQEPENETI